jgi:hypothetical protein
MVEAHAECEPVSTKSMSLPANEWSDEKCSQSHPAYAAACGMNR